MPDGCEKTKQMPNSAYGSSYVGGRWLVLNFEGSILSARISAILFASIKN